MCTIFRFQSIQLLWILWHCKRIQHPPTSTSIPSCGMFFRCSAVGRSNVAPSVVYYCCVLKWPSWMKPLQLWMKRRKERCMKSCCSFHPRCHGGNVQRHQLSVFLVGGRGLWKGGFKPWRPLEMGFLTCRWGLLFSRRLRKFGYFSPSFLYTKTYITPKG